MQSAYDIPAKTIQGEMVSLAQFKGKWSLVVNVASACGLTPQYAGLQELHQSYSSRGLVVLGFPCNQFGAQEPGSETEIAEFCSSRFQVSFPMFAKVDVNGPNTHPLYQYLKEQNAGGQGAEIEWNFAKFLLDDKGQVVERFHPKTTPEEIAQLLERYLPARG